MTRGQAQKRDVSQVVLEPLPCLNCHHRESLSHPGKAVTPTPGWLDQKGLHWAETPGLLEKWERRGWWVGSASPFPLVQIQLALPVPSPGLRDWEQRGSSLHWSDWTDGWMSPQISRHHHPPHPPDSLTLSVSLLCFAVWQRARSQGDKDKGSPAHMLFPGPATHS